MTPASDAITLLTRIAVALEAIAARLPHSATPDLPAQAQPERVDPADVPPVSQTAPAVPKEPSAASLLKKRLREIVAETWETDTPTDDIRCRMNEAAGRPLSPETVYSIARQLGLKRYEKREPVPVAPDPTAPIDADFESIARWAGARGIEYRSQDDLGRVNRKRMELGLQQFRFAPGVRRVGV